MDSEDDDDATSWDGGDEDEEEPEQMELDDDDEDDVASQSSADEEPQSLVVTLHYRKLASDTRNTPDEANAPAIFKKGAMPNGDVSMADAAVLPKPEVLVAPATITPSQPAFPLPHIVPTAIPNGVSAHQPEVMVVPKVEHQQPAGETTVLQKLDQFVSAPTPPYSAPEETMKQEQAQPPPVQPDAVPRQPVPTGLAMNSQTQNWQ